MFIFVVFLLLILLCFFMYAYLTNQIISQRKRIMLLVNQNSELKSKLNKLMSSTNTSKPDDTPCTESQDETEV